MNPVDIVILICVAAAVAGVVICLVRQRKKYRANACGGCCNGCPYARESCKPENNTHNI